MPPRTVPLELTATERKVRRLRLAGKICWYLSAAMTVNFVRQVLSGAIPDEAIALISALIISVAVQYVLTMTESALFDGTLPAPWNVEWREGGSTPWLVVGAIVCLVLDVLLNLGGVAYFLGKLQSSDMGQDTLRVSSSVIAFVTWFITVTFAIFIAVGPELLDEFANLIEEQNRPMTEARHTAADRHVDQQRQLSDQERRQRLEDERAAQRAAQEKRAQEARAAAEKRNAAVEVK